MSKLNCNCGHSTSFTQENDNELSLFMNEQIFTMTEALITGSLSNSEIRAKLLFDSQEVYRCEKCKRLYISGTENAERTLYIYALEEIQRESDEDDEAR